MYPPRPGPARGVGDSSLSQRSQGMILDVAVEFTYDIQVGDRVFVEAGALLPQCFQLVSQVLHRLSPWILLEHKVVVIKGKTAS
jgi:hypothetical protein